MVTMDCRNYVFFYINGRPYQVSGKDVLMPLSDFLRQKLFLTGTKVVCAEGDCGACTVLRAFPSDSKGILKDSTGRFRAINSCISPVFLMDGAHIITVEGVKDGEALGPVQEAMVKHHGAQCGYCTPGMVMSLTQLCEDRAEEQGKISSSQVKNYLTGNLCRCTGYKGIIEAGLDMDMVAQKDFLNKHYRLPEIEEKLIKVQQQPYHIKGEQFEIFAPTTFSDATQLKQEHPDLKLISSATDLGVLVNKDKMEFKRILSLHLIDEAYIIQEKDHNITVGAKVSLTALRKTLKKRGEGPLMEFANLLHMFASPQIKNLGTLVGNVANASPIGDTLPFLMVSEAKVELLSTRGSREVALPDFYIGYKKMDMKADEFIQNIHIPVPPMDAVIKIYKVAKRKDLDISTVSTAFWLQRDEKTNTISRFKMALGGVAATPVRLKTVEHFLQGKQWCEETVNEAIELILKEINPLSDVRGSATYRLMLVENLMRKFFNENNTSSKC